MNINKLLDTKKKKIIAGVIVLCLIIGGGFGIYTLVFDDVDKKEVTKEIVLKTLTEDDIKDYVAGIDDIYVVENSTNIDFLKNIVVDSDMINSVEVDTENLETSKIGDYTITYLVTVNTSKKKFKDNEESIKINKTVHVVSQETAQSLANEDKIVYTHDMEMVLKSNGETVESEETETIKNSTAVEKINSENKTNTTRTTDTNSSSSNSNKNNNSNSSSSNSSSGNSSSNGSSNSNSDNSSSSNKGNSPSSNSNGNSSQKTENDDNNTGSKTENVTKHTHSYDIPVYKTVTVTEAYDETITVTDAYDEPVYEARLICGCGKQFNTAEEWFDHIDKDDCPYGYSVKKVQTGIKHHDAVTKTVHHDAVTKQIIDYYKCSCGAKK